MDAPIFIVGCSRSGTHLLRNIVNGHPDIGLCSESRFFTTVWRPETADLPLDDAAAERALTASIRAGGTKPGVPSAAFLHAFAETDRTPRAFYDTVLRVYAAMLGKRIFGDKTPHHFLFLPEILAWYPGARMILMVRHPAATHASFKKHVRYGRMSAFDRSSVIRAFHWNLSIAKVEAVAASHPHARIMKVRYEDLVEHSERETRAVCRFLDVDYSSDMLDVAEHNSSFASGAGPGIFRSGLGRGELLRPVERIGIEAVSGGRMLQEGYAPAALPVPVVRALKLIGAYRGVELTHALFRRMRAALS